MNITLRKKSDTSGFTIVELLIVIVVIAILAAITIVSYNGISARARQNAMQANVEQVAKSIMNYKTLNGAYPSSLGLLNSGQGVKTSNDAQYAYTGTNDDFCVTIGSLTSQDTFYVSNTSGRVQSGYCPGHSGSAFQGYPSRLGSTDFSSTPGSGDTLAANISSIPDGSWMVVILAYTNTSDSIPPAGWTTLVTRKTTNSMQTSIYAKIKQSGDTASQEFDAGGTSGAGTTNGLLLWGGNSAAIGSWTLGSFGDRSVNATPTTVVTPTVSVGTAKSLVLSIATERTTAEETNYTSLTGATAWAYVAQPTSPAAGSTSKIQTITVGYNEQENTGTSQAMTVTYPNSQNTNGTGIQLVIPPAS